MLKTSKRTYKKLIDSQESPSCRGKNNILRRDLDTFKKCMLKECKLEVNKDNRISHNLHNNIVCLNEFKKFQFETELAYQTEALRQMFNQDKKYISMATDDRERALKRLTLQIRSKLLEKFNVPRSKWKEMYLNETDSDEATNKSNYNLNESTLEDSQKDIDFEFDDDQSVFDKKSINSENPSTKTGSSMVYTFFCC